jgi:hypothetical protein
MISTYLRSAAQIPGWFSLDDILLFDRINQLQQQAGVVGNLLEIGVYYGRSAILLGYFLQPKERLFVCDAFEGPLPTDDNKAESAYALGVTRRQFEENYRRFHDRLPEILACSSTELGKADLPRDFRFIHIDGGHLYEIVRNDIAVTKCLRRERGIVIFDDYCTHPGVSAAVWEEVANGGLFPICLTNKKLYAAWEPQSETVEQLRSWASDAGVFQVDSERMRGHEFLRFRMTAPRVSLFTRLYRKILKLTDHYQPHAETLRRLEKKGYG